MSVTRGFNVSNMDLRKNFERALDNAINKGEPAPSHTGLDYEVEKALVDVALAFPKGRDLESQARKAFEDSLVSEED